MKWYLHALRNYAVFKGRARRREYWTFELINSAIALALFVLAVLAGRAGYPYFLSLPFLYIAATIIPSLADTNRSGSWFFASMIPVVGPFILFAMTVTDSNPGENRFGPNPKQQPTREGALSPEMGYLAPPIDRQ
jgi:uncharacterized membrane protein YhaH (DUF805 family)